MKNSKWMRLFFSAVFFMAVCCKSAVFAEEAVAPDTEETPTFNPSDVPSPSKDDCNKQGRAKNFIFTVVLFGVAAIALAFVSHNAD